MSTHIVSSFSDVIGHLTSEIANMGQQVTAQLRDVLEALESRDLELARRVRKADKEIDDRHDQIEAQVLDVLALRHPVAVDLRQTITALKISHELERIGDLASNIAKRSEVILSLEPVSGMDKISKMGEVAIKIVDDVIAAYVEASAEQAIAVWTADQEIDEYCNEIFASLLTDMMERKSNVNACSQMTFVAKNLERVGDHATNIAESVHYALTGEKIGEKRPKNDQTSSTIVKP